MTRCGKMTFTATRHNLSFPQITKQLLIVKLAIEFVNFRYFFLKFIFIALRQASHDEKLLNTPFILSCDEFQNHIDTFFLGTLYKATCIHDCDFTLQAFTIVYAMITVYLELLHQQFAVYKIFRAPHRDNINLVSFHLFIK